MSDYFDRIEQQLVRLVEATAPRPRRLRPRLNVLAPAISVAVAIAVVVVFLGLRGTGSSKSGAGGGVELVYQAEPTPQVPRVTVAALARAVLVMREQVAAAGDTGVSIRVSHDDIFVRIPTAKDLARVQRTIGTTAELYFYDWEANVLLPDGSTVASKLLEQNQTALQISEGAGQPSAGSMTLYNAVRLASKQRQSLGSSESKAQYYLFGSGGSGACAAAMHFYGVAPAPAGEHCLLGGPANTRSDLRQSLPSGVSISQDQLLVIKPGTVVLQAVPESLSNAPKPAAPSTRFYALRDRAALDGNDITNPRQSTDSGGTPDVEFGFTPKGASAFANLTAGIAHRGSEVSGVGSSLEQHFAVSLDGLLVTVPSIDYSAYPDGVPSGQGGQITSGLTVSSARKLATELRMGALPIGLRLVSDTKLSAPG